ncbi:MAG: hypothetical protein ACTSWQ_08915, partial [Candidatus Thorarchaeota archaeon]
MLTMTMTVMTQTALSKISSKSVNGVSTDYRRIRFGLVGVAMGLSIAQTIMRFPVLQSNMR